MKDDEIGRIKEAAESVLTEERRRVDSARLEADGVRIEHTAYQARTGAKIERLQDDLRLSTDRLTRVKLDLARELGKNALLERTCAHSIDTSEVDPEIQTSG